MAVITISRQYGSGGDEIAARVCETLDYRFFDKDLMAQVASEIGLSESEIVDFTEDNYNVQSFLARLLGGRGSRIIAQAGSEATETTQLDEEQAIHMVRGTIEAAHKQGDVVIVGRGGQAILQDKPDVLHVRIEAPRDTRITRVRYHDFSGLATDFQQRYAEERVAGRDRAAAAYLKRIYDLDWADAGLYHLIVDTRKWGTEAAACLIASAVSCLPAASARPARAI